MFVKTFIKKLSQSNFDKYALFTVITAWNKSKFLIKSISCLKYGETINYYISFKYLFVAITFLQEVTKELLSMKKEFFQFLLNNS